MKKQFFLWLAMISSCSLNLASAQAGYEIAHSVVGAGGATTSGPGNTVQGTLGQSFVGVTGENDVGFWYTPGPIITAIDNELDKLPTVYSLEQNYPNPFNPRTTIAFQLPKESHVILKVYDARGREVATLVNHNMMPGFHHVPFDGSGLSSGVYFYRLRADEFLQTRKLVLLK